MKKTYYITTAIAYASAIPHIGNVYEAIFADSIARFKRLDGFDVFFQTGTDEHGQKIETNAKRQELSPQNYVDLISDGIKDIYDMVNVSYDKFARTTDAKHQKRVKKIFDTLLKQGDIYLGKYEGWYSVADESFLTETEIVDGKGPSGDIPVWTSEEAYFFKLNKYQDRLIKHIEENPDFISPEIRKNEIVNMFLKDKLPDLSITRTSFDWGIKVSDSPNHVLYVWIDALSNYITFLGYDPQSQSEEFKKYWPADVHIIGKDIMRFHVIYWPILLLALNIPLPKKIFGHPWILFNKNKLSKSTHNVVYTDFLVSQFGVDTIRYYVLHEIPYSSDGNLTYELIIERHNSDLANTLGNLINRTIGMVNKYQDGMVKKIHISEPFEYSLEEKAVEALPKIRKLIDELKVGDALDEVIQLSRFANKYVDISAPWTLYKNGETDKLAYVLYSLVETIRYIAVLLQPFLPETADKIFTQIKSNDKSFKSLENFGVYKEQTIGEAKVLFERYDLEKKLETIQGKES